MIPPIPLPRSARPGGYPSRRPILDGIGRMGNTLGYAGMGLLSGKNWQEGLANAAAGAMQGGEVDAERRDLQRKEEEKLRRAKMNAQFLPGNEALQQAVASGDLDFQTAYQLWQKDRELAGEAGGGVYGGTSMDAQNWNILLKGASDPSYIASPEYAAAYAQITQPRVTYQQTAEGVVPVMETPQIPAWVKAPPGMGQAPGGDASMMAPTAPGEGTAGVQPGSPIPGTLPRPTESQNRLGMMAQTIINEVPTLHANFDAMNDMGQQLIAMGGAFANPWLDEDYQQAAQAVATSASQVLYALSGAAAGDAETEKRIKELTPQFGDKPGTIADKLRRFDNYVMTIANASGDPEMKRVAQEALTRVRRGRAGPPMAPGSAPATTSRTTSTGVTWSPG